MKICIIVNDNAYKWMTEYSTLSTTYSCCKTKYIDWNILRDVDITSYPQKLGNKAIINKPIVGPTFTLWFKGDHCSYWEQL
jgi:hypothetical protein